MLDLVEQLRNLGINSGGVLLVHCAFSKVGQIPDGVLGLINALRSVLGENGTLVMPSMSWDDKHPFLAAETSVKDEMGILADTFWRLTDVLRSDSPHSFAAVGRYAGMITVPHPIDVPHGLDSPVGRIYELDGQVLLIGIGHDSNTTIHLAEMLAGVRYRSESLATVLIDNQIQQVEFGEINHCCENFVLVDDWLNEKGLQTIGKLGQAECRLMNSRDLVKVVVEHLQAEETIFLHPFGVDEECDEARRSLQKYE